MPRKEAKRAAEATSSKKAKAESSAPSKKRKAESSQPDTQKPEFEDWRSPLYYWHGTIVTGGDGVTVWEGTWIASEDGLPTPAEFEASHNTFRLQSSDFLDRDGVPLEAHCPYGRRGDFTGSFKLNNDGRGFANYSDIEHRIVFKNHSAGWLLVGARGLAEFGEFVSAGRLTFPQGNSPAYLTLARRYLIPDDPRIQLGAWEMLLHIERNMEGREAPWKQLTSSGG